MIEDIEGGSPRIGTAGSSVSGKHLEAATEFPRRRLLGIPRPFGVTSLVAGNFSSRNERNLRSKQAVSIGE